MWVRQVCLNQLFEYRPGIGDQPGARSILAGRLEVEDVNPDFVLLTRKTPNSKETL